MESADQPGFQPGFQDGEEVEPPRPRTIFSDKPTPFPVPVDGKISTQKFLAAASGVVSLVDHLGKVFSAVRYDMNGNIQKITNMYDEDPDKFEYLNDMILFERSQGKLRATDALLWLRRALHFIHNFLLSIHEDTKLNKRPEDLSENIRKAYSETLEIHHGWMAQRLFSVLSKLIPSRSQLFRTLALETQMAEEFVLNDLEMFLINMNSNITALMKFYLDHKLDPQ